MAYTVRTAIEADIPAIIELFKLSLGTEGGAPVESFWRWKHIENPFGVSPVLLAIEDDKLIGLRAFMRWQWILKGKVIPAFRAVDTATHPDFRGKGIFSKLTLKLIEDLKQSEPPSIIYNTPNTQSKPGYLKMKWEVLGKPNVIGGLALAYKGNVKNGFLSYHKDLQAVDFNKITYKASDKNGLVHTNYSLAYFKWRYQSIPEIPYATFIYEKNGKSLMLFFHIKERKPFYELRICDELWLHGDIDADFRYKAYHKLARNLGTTFFTFISNNHISTSQKMLQRLFSLQKYAPEITVREVNDSNLFNNINDINNWAFNLGDLELF